MATVAETGLRPAHLIEYNKMGFKLVGLGKDGTPLHKWGPIYDNPNFWTNEALVKNALEFRYGVATTFGLTKLSDEQGSLYLNNLDIDSDKVHDILFILRNPSIEYKKYSLIQNLFENGCVVKTRKLKGYQLYWFSHKQYEPIHAQDCIPDHGFEIKTDKSSGVGTLPPSRHRNDPNFEYHFKAKSKIPISDEAYDAIIEVLRDCLIQKPRSEKPLQLEENSEQSRSKENSEKSGSEDKKQETYGNGKIDGLQLEDDERDEIVELLQPYYKKPNRNFIVFALSSVLRRQGICKDSVIAVTDKLARDEVYRGISQEIPDVKNALRQVEDVFKDDINIMAGNDHLKHVIYYITGLRDKATEIFTKIFNIIHKVQDRRPKEQQESRVNWLVKNVMTEYVCQTVNDNGELFVYDEKRGVYLRNQEWRIRTLCRSMVM